MVSLALAAPVDPTTGLDVFPAVAPLLVALIAVSGVVWTVVSNNRRERERQTHERKLKELELDATRESRFREERIKAYSTLARLTKTMSLEAPEDPLPAVYEALSQVEILAQDPKLREIGEELVDTWAGAWRSAHGAHLEGVGPLESPFDTPGYRNREGLISALRNAFIDLAKNELGVEGRTTGLADLEGSNPGEALPGPEAKP